MGEKLAEVRVRLHLLLQKGEEGRIGVHVLCVESEGGGPFHKHNTHTADRLSLVLPPIHSFLELCEGGGREEEREDWMENDGETGREGARERESESERERARMCEYKLIWVCEREDT